MIDVGNFFDESHIAVNDKDVIIWGCCSRKHKVLLMLPIGVAAIQVLFRGKELITKVSL